MTATRGPQVVLEGYARDVARGGGGKTMRDNIAAMDALQSAGLVADGSSVDGTSRTGGKAYDPVVAQFPHAPVPAWEIPAPLLDLSVSGGGGGPFLPLTGGTVSGPTNVTSTITAYNYATPGNAITLAGSAVPAPLGNFGANWQGTSALANNTSVNAFSIGTSYDNISFPPAGTRNELFLGGSYGGPNFSGSRVGMMVQMNWTTASPLCNPTDAIVLYGGVAVGNVNVGGVAAGFNVSQFGVGKLFGSNPWARLASGATYWNEVVGTEIDVSLGAGSSCAALQGLQVIVTSDHQVKAGYGSGGVGIAAQSGAAANLDVGYSLGSLNAQWPIDPNAGYVFQTYYSGNAVAPHCAGGIDLLQLIPDGPSGKFGGGFSFRGPGAVAASAMDASGSWKIGTGYISSPASGLNIDAALYVLTGTPTIAVSGSGYSNGDRVTDRFGNLFSLTVSGGTVSAVAVVQRAEGNGTNQTGTILTTAVSRTGGQFGSGLTLNENWTRSGTQLALQTAYAGATVLGGTLWVQGASAYIGGGGANGLNIIPGSTGATAIQIQQSGSGGIFFNCPLFLTGGLTASLGLGLFGATAVATKPTVTGAKGSNAALASLLTALAAYGFITDSSTA